MDIDNTCLVAIRNWYQSHWAARPLAIDHYLTYARWWPAEHIIYGMDDPQKKYLTLLQACQVFKPKPKQRDPASAFRNFAASRLGADMNGKAWDEHVSNYVLDVTIADVHWDPAYQPWLERRGRAVSGHDVSASLREKARSDFTDDYEGSHYGLGRATKLVGGIQKNDPAIKSQTDVDGLSDHDHALDLKGYVVRRACKYLI